MQLEIAERDLRWHALLAAAPGKTAWFAWLPWGDALLDGRADLGSVRLDAGRTLRGRVHGAGGKPVPGATVTATDLLTDRRRMLLESRGPSAADGSFELAGVCASIRVEVSAPGHYTTTLPHVDPAEPLDVELAVSGYVSGRVLAPPSIARRLLLQLDAELLDGFEVEPLGQAGRFRCSVTRPGRMRVVTFEPSGDTLTSVGMSEILGGPKDDVFVPTGWSDDQPTLVVRARDRETQRSVAPIRAAASWGSMARFTSGVPYDGIASGDDGAVRLVPPPQPAKGTVVAVADGYAPAQVTDVVWDPAKAQEIVVDLERESALEGKVIEVGTNRALAGLRVQATRVGGGRPRASRTASDGTFRIAGLGANRYRLEAIAPDGQPMERLDTIDLGVAERRTDLELRVRPATLLRGSIAGAGDASDLAVVLGQSTRSLAPFSRPGPLAAGGAFELRCSVDLPAELLLLEPGPFGRSPRYHWLGTIRGAEGPQSFTVAGDRRVRVRGRVTTGDLAVPPGRLLIVARPRDYRSEGSPFELALAWSEGQHWALVSAEGTYELDLWPVPMRITCVDAVTGVELARAERDPATGPPADLDFELKLASIDCRFPEPFGRELWLDVAAPEPVRRGETTGGRLMDEASIKLGGTVRQVTALVPAGEVTLSVRPGWRFAETGKQRSGGDAALAKTTLTVKAGERSVVELRPRP